MNCALIPARGWIYDTEFRVWNCYHQGEIIGRIAGWMLLEELPNLTSMVYLFGY